MKKVFVPEQFAPTINVVYPPHNVTEFERWLCINCKNIETEREYLPLLWTGYYVNNNYGNDTMALAALQKFLQSLDTSKKYWTVVQYDDNILNNVSHLDLLQFCMSAKDGIGLPLLSEPMPYEFSGGKKYFANFVGSRTHPIRDSADRLKSMDGYFISFDRMEPELYCKVLYESMFTLCYRGYGRNSFRIREAMQYHSIPVYISDEFIIPNGVEFEEYGILIHADDAHRIDEIIQSVPIETVLEKQDKIHFYYEKYYTYRGAMNYIKHQLEHETRNSRHT